MGTCDCPAQPLQSQSTLQITNHKHKYGLIHGIWIYLWFNNQMQSMIKIKSRKKWLQKLNSAKLNMHFTALKESS